MQRLGSDFVFGRTGWPTLTFAPGTKLLVLASAVGLVFTLVNCGGDTQTEPAPTTPPPSPPQPPAPSPPPPAPTGLHVSGTTSDSITWTWNAVDDATGYSVQISADAAFDDSDPVAATTETSHTAKGLTPGTSQHLRVRAMAGSAAAPRLSSWTVPVAGMSAMLPPPPAPMGLHVSARGENFIEWSWDPVPGATGYQVQFSLDEVFTEEDEVIDRPAEQTSYRRDNVLGATNASLRVRSLAGTGDDQLHGEWSTDVPWTTAVSPATRFLLACPTPDEVAQFNRDLDIVFIDDPTADAPLGCTEAEGSVDLTVLQVGAYQTLRLMRIAEFAEPLPWTMSLYDWFVGTVRQLVFDSNAEVSSGSYDGRVVIAHKGGDGPGLIGAPSYKWPDYALWHVLYLQVFVHEARHTEGIPHTCNGIHDETFEEMGAWAYAILTKVWFSQEFVPPEFFSPEAREEMIQSARGTCHHRICDRSCPV